MYPRTVKVRSSSGTVNQYVRVVEAYRDGGKVKTRTLANLTGWAPERVEALRQALKGGAPESGAPLERAFAITRSRPHGHVAALVGTARRIGLEQLVVAGQGRRGALALALVVARLLHPGSKLATARGLAPDTLATSLGEVLGIAGASADELYGAMDALGERQGEIERALAARHLGEATLVLYDLTSAAIEGRRCPLARLGYARDGVRGRAQIEFGLLTTTDGLPVAVEVFAGNTSDPASLASQVDAVPEPGAVGDGVFNVDSPGGVAGPGDIDFELEKPVSGALLVFKFGAALVRDLVKLNEQRVIRAGRPGIVHRNVTIDTLILAGEDKRDLLLNAGGAVFIHVDRTVEVGNSIAAGQRGQAENQQQDHREHFPAGEGPASGMAR